LRTLTRFAVGGAVLVVPLGLSALAQPDPAGGDRARLAVSVSQSPSPMTPMTPMTPRRSPSQPLSLPMDPTPSAPEGGGKRGDAAPAPRAVTVLLSGDLLWHNSVWQSAHEDALRRGLPQRFDFDPMFAGMKPLVESADLAICHEEVPFAADDEHLSNYPIFAAPPEIARWIASMGWDACTTDSNHSIDEGVGGLVRTADLLERAGVRHVGTFRSPAERDQPVILTTPQGVKVAVVGGTYSLNGFRLPPRQRWAVSMWDADNLLAQARAARAAGADIVLVQYHGGDEYSRLPNAQQVALVRRLTASPAVDLVFAEHAHVVQPITKLNGTWVVYGMGNMVGQSDPAYPRAYEGISVRITFAEARHGFRVIRAAYIPTSWNIYSPGDPIRVRPVLAALRHGAGDRLRLLEARRMTRLAVNGLHPRVGATTGLRER